MSYGWPETPPSRYVGTLRNFAMLLALAVFACRGSRSDNSEGSESSKKATTPYEAYLDAGGPFCGKDARGAEVECEPLGNCVSTQERRCVPSDGPYQAYWDAKGPYCGKDSRGAEVECQPRHTCADEEKSICRPQ